MNAPSDDIKDILLAAGDSSEFSFDLGDDLHVGVEPSKPNVTRCVTISDSPGFSPMLGLTTVGYEYPFIQILIRHIDYLDGYNLANDIKDYLHGRANETRNGSLYTLIRCTGNPAFLEKNDSGRFLFVINFNLQRRAA